MPIVLNEPMSIDWWGRFFCGGGLDESESVVFLKNPFSFPDDMERNDKQVQGGVVLLAWF